MLVRVSEWGTLERALESDRATIWRRPVPGGLDEARGRVFGSVAAGHVAGQIRYW